ncbi:MAG: hypothetical protein Greene041619_929 [Candidatus Peregrinibacteria bacterium Greene0416_19]|nr:MAG: hypothetical protein Greene041619_929 [Candidatus Peregrinibacteria bacterium Greene0416_19]
MSTLAPDIPVDGDVSIPSAEAGSPASNTDIQSSVPTSSVSAAVVFLMRDAMALKSLLPDTFALRRIGSQAERFFVQIERSHVDELQLHGVHEDRRGQETARTSMSVNGSVLVSSSRLETAAAAHEAVLAKGNGPYQVEELDRMAGSAGIGPVCRSVVADCQKIMNRAFEAAHRGKRAAAGQRSVDGRCC